MKRFLTVLLLLFLIIIPYQIKAEPEPEDMTLFRIAILLQHCDQSDKIKVVRLRNSQTGKDGFCLEPYVGYKPSANLYYKQANNNKKLYDLYRAYELLEKSDEAFITVQLMIWEELFDETFTFDGKGASDYLKNEVLEILEDEPETDTDVISDEAYVNKKKQLSIQDLDKYSISSDVTITDTEEDNLTYIVEEYTDDTLQIILEPLSDVPEGAYTYTSENSQDIYVFEGEFEPLRSKRVDIRALSDDLSFTYSKLDLNDQPIEGAEFTLYRIDPQADGSLYFLKAGASIDLYEKLVSDLNSYDRSDLSISVSERYSPYILDGNISTSQLGYFPFVIKHNDEILKEGRIYVTDDIDEDFVEVKVEQIKTVRSTGETANTVNGLKPDNKYYFCESEPQKGYTYVNKPCQIIDTSDDSYKDEHIFYNDKRTYTLNLIKNNPERTIALNGALFRLSYTDNNEEKEFVFKTGSLNIFKEGDFRYAIYHYEGTDDFHIAEFISDSYIEDNVPYGKYYYYLSNDKQIDPDKVNREVVVKEGSFIIENLPYSSDLKLEELEAPKGYFIDEAVFELSADIPYSDITFTNSRVNSFDIIPRNIRKIPKTCIGE